MLIHYPKTRDFKTTIDELPRRRSRVWSSRVCVFHGLDPLADRANSWSAGLVARVTSLRFVMCAFFPQPWTKAEDLSPLCLPTFEISKCDVFSLSLEYPTRSSVHACHQLKKGVSSNTRCRRKMKEKGKINRVPYSHLHADGRCREVAGTR